MKHILTDKTTRILSYTIYSAIKNFASYIDPPGDAHTRVHTTKVAGICHFVTTCGAGVIFNHRLYKLLRILQIYLFYHL